MLGMPYLLICRLVCFQPKFEVTSFSAGNAGEPPTVPVALQLYTHIATQRQIGAFAHQSGFFEKLVHLGFLLGVERD